VLESALWHRARQQWAPVGVRSRLQQQWALCCCALALLSLPMKSKEALVVGCKRRHEHSRTLLAAHGGGRGSRWARVMVATVCRAGQPWPAMGQPGEWC
jgi:hypothetical protein